MKWFGLFLLFFVSVQSHVIITWYQGVWEMDDGVTDVDYLVGWWCGEPNQFSVIECDGPNSTVPKIGGFQSPNDTTDYFEMSFAKQPKNQTYWFYNGLAQNKTPTVRSIYVPDRGEYVPPIWEEESETSDSTESTLITEQTMTETIADKSSSVRNAFSIWMFIISFFFSNQIVKRS
eukprot:TRINITY_DN6206_c0_g1_i1.p1 TRINITY_DN6206_c0_g1~~TRINITY_DN6206_c0_g1_i1.p1  ORF type:complete len:176 (-),score=35.26 TRINITY_DN6206_c0_g1_i1:111-638(-)